MHFQSFAQIPKVAELAGRVSTLQRSLQMNVMREFELLGTGEESTNPLLLERLKACCLVTDALGYKVGSVPNVLMWYNTVAACVILCGVSVLCSCTMVLWHTAPSTRRPIWRCVPFKHPRLDAALVSSSFCFHVLQWSSLLHAVGLLCC